MSLHLIGHVQRRREEVSELFKPAGTESRWDPITTVAFGRPVRVSAMTLNVGIANKHNKTS
jgi:hypothetical protein